MLINMKLNLLDIYYFLIFENLLINVFYIYIYMVMIK